jgi:hypothetical protein
MTKQDTKAKRGAPKKKTLKVRRNISIHPTILKVGEKIAFDSGLSFSTWLEQLIRENQARESA